MRLGPFPQVNSKTLQDGRPVVSFAWFEPEGASYSEDGTTRQDTNHLYVGRYSKVNGMQHFKLAFPLEVTVLRPLAVQERLLLSCRHTWKHEGLGDGIRVRAVDELGPDVSDGEYMTPPQHWMIGTTWWVDVTGLAGPEQRVFQVTAPNRDMVNYGAFTLGSQHEPRTALELLIPTARVMDAMAAAAKSGGGL